MDPQNSGRASTPVRKKTKERWFYIEPAPVEKELKKCDISVANIIFSPRRRESIITPSAATQLLSSGHNKRVKKLQHARRNNKRISECQGSKKSGIIDRTTPTVHPTSVPDVSTPPPHLVFDSLESSSLSSLSSRIGDDDNDEQIIVCQGSRKAGISNRTTPPAILPTPVPVASSPPQHLDFDSPESSSLSSLSLLSSRTSVDNNDEFSMPKVVPARVKCRSDLITDITIQDADARTVPSIGPELLALVQEAKDNLELTRHVHPDVARFVDGGWLVPEVCDSCRVFVKPNGTIKCDRAFPCSACVKNNRQCNQRTYMNHQAKRKSSLARISAKKPTANRQVSSNSVQFFGNGQRETNKKGKSNSQKDSHDVLEYLNSAHVAQNSDGTWNTTKQGHLTSHPRKRSRKDIDASQAMDKLPPKKKLIAYGFVPIDPKTSTTSKHRRTQPTTKNVGDGDFDLSNAHSDTSSDEFDEKVSRNAKSARQPIGQRHKTPRGSLPAPFGQPPVWASKRQQLCETLPYYRAYQSGGYIHNGIVQALLIDKEVRVRDVFDEEIIITRCGGGRLLDAVSGQMLQKINQEKSSFGLGFERSREIGNPVAIIAGQGNWKSPSKLPHYYNVLDWFHVTDVWAEQIEGFKTWCVRLEKISLDKKSWWASIDSAPLDPNRDINAIKSVSAECLHCKTASKTIFDQGWACLKASCPKFFDFNSAVDIDNLTYTTAFLKERTSYSGKPPGPLAPPLITESDMIIAARSGTESYFKQGIVCPLCKCCSRRRQWARWSCEAEGCNFTYTLPIRTISVRDATTEKVDTSKAAMHDPAFGITFEAKRLGAYNVFDYGVPGPGGKTVGVLRLFKSTAAINHQPGGPNDIFRLMQENDLDLWRRPVRQTDATGEIITSHFATNWGAPYKFVVAQSTRGFNEAPPVIVKALKRLTWAGEQMLTDVGEPFHPFNELLSIGYFEDSNIGYHDDGESTLGPTVATLSLGSSASMALRPKAKAALGNNSKNAKGTKAPVLRVNLDHGDMVIMHGSGVQKYYEHEVTPNGILRFAMTCRYVRPETLANEKERKDAMIKSQLPDGHEQYNYDGDVDAVFTQGDMEKDEKIERLEALKRMVNDVAALYMSSVSQGDIDELSQIRNLMKGFQDMTVISDKNGHQEYEDATMDQVDVPMVNAP